MSHNNYATFLHEKLGRPQEAEEHYGSARGGPHKRALALDPGNAQGCGELLSLGYGLCTAVRCQLLDENNLVTPDISSSAS